MESCGFGGVTVWDLFAFARRETGSIFAKFNRAGHLKDYWKFYLATLHFFAGRGKKGEERLSSSVPYEELYLASTSASVDRNRSFCSGVPTVTRKLSGIP